MSQEEVATEYGIAIDDVKAGLAYAAAVLEQQEIRALA